jgi:hypothetical protein
MPRVTEDKIQKWLENNYENLQSIILNTEIIDNINKDDKIVPYYSIDYMINKKIIKSAKFVFDNLYLLELITANQNISLETSERLFPDLLLFNPETNKFIIVEIKRSSQAEREAITELLAYEQELQNIFPFMSKLEVCFIVISADYNTLLEHSIYSLALWQNKKILPLKISGLESEDESNWNLSVHIPNSWSLISLEHFKAEQISTVHLVLYDKEAYNHDVDIKEKEDNFEILQRGIELIVKEGEKYNSSGFVLLSRMTHTPLSNWVITLGIINPFSFFKEINYNSKIKDIFQNKFDFEIYSDIDITNQAKEYLDIFYNTSYETFTTWDICKLELKDISIPLSIDFFGELDNIVNDFVLNPKVRKYYFPELNENKINWKTPIIGLNLLDNILGENIFYTGVFSFENIYKFGTIIGTLLKYLQIFNHSKENKDNERFLGKYYWIELEFLKSYREIGQRLLSTSDIKKELIPFKSLYLDNINKNIENINNIIQWFIEDFLNEDIHRYAFTIGIEINNYFYDNKKISHPEEITYIENLIIETTKKLINKDFEENELVQYALKDELEYFKNILELDDSYNYSKIENEDIINFFETHTIPLYSQSVMDVFHSLADIDKSLIDFDFLKKTYIKEYSKNNRSVIALLPNGSLVIQIPPENMPILMKINPEEEVLYLDYKTGGIQVLQKLTWDKFLESNKTLEDE